MQRKLKHSLPAFSSLEHLRLEHVTLQALQDCVKDLNQQFISVFETNKNLCSIHHALASDVYSNFFQIALTESEVEQEVDAETCKATYDKLHQGRSSESLRRKKDLSTIPGSVFNELSYLKKSEVYAQYRTLFDKVLAPIKGQATRVRLVRLAAGASVPPHIDYDPSYAVRIIIPIVSTSECLNIFWVKNKIESVFLEPGQAYFLNTGYKHAVINLAATDRYTFMVTVAGTEDIQHLIRE